MSTHHRLPREPPPARRHDLPPEPRQRARHRRRRLVLLGGLLTPPAITAILLGLGGGGKHALYTPRGAISHTLLARTPGTPVAPAVPAGPSASAPRTQEPAFTPSAKALALAARMPVATQAAEIFLVGLPGSAHRISEDLAGAPWGGFVLIPPAVPDAAAARAFADEAAAVIRAAGDAAPWIGVAQAGGARSAITGLPPLPQPRQRTPAGATGQARAAARALTALGFNLTLAVAADVGVPEGALSGALFPGDAGAVARLTAASLGGYRTGGMTAAVGHFPGEGAASADPEVMSATVGGSLDALRARDLMPFTSAARSASMVMLSGAVYAALDGVTPADLLPATVSLLRGLGFGGVVMSDDLDAALQPTGLDAGAVALAALRAGDGLLFISGTPHERLHALATVVRAAERDRSVAALVRRALLRVLTLKDRAGLI